MRIILPRSRLTFIFTVFILISILIVLTKTAFTPVDNLPTKSTNPTTIKKVNDPCQPFTIEKNEINCEEAKKIALSKYPDQVLSIDKKTITYKQRRSSGSQEKKIWLVTIKPSDELLEKVEVAIERISKNVLFIQPYLNNNEQSQVVQSSTLK